MRWQKNKHPRRPVNLARFLYSGCLGLFLLLGLTACSSAGQNLVQAAPTSAPHPTDILSYTPPASPVPTAVQANAVVIPTTTATPAVTSLPIASASPTPIAFATSTAAAVTPTVTSRTGWKTYVSTKLQIAIDYPADWSVREDAANVTFVSPQGATIQLVPVETSGLSPEDWLNENLLPNTRCSTRTNEHGLTAQICFDTLAFTHTANFVISSSGTSRLLSLTTGKRDDVVIFAMVASLRLAS